MKAYCLIRKEPHYRHEAFAAGLAAAGYRVEVGYPGWPPSRGDVMVIWNRYEATERIADNFEAGGGTVLVAENGYIGHGGGTPKLEVAKAVQPGHYYALARHAHNGRGQWAVGGPERLRALDIELKPWVKAGGHILVCANRSFGMRGGVMPREWAADVEARLKRVTKRRIVVRHHPGNFAAPRSLAEDLKDAHACVIWSSSSGVHALAAGVPVICEAPWWICKPATFASYLEFERQAHCSRPDVFALARDAARQFALERLAWAQWQVSELASGAPFRHLLASELPAQVAHVCTS